MQPAKASRTRNLLAPRAPSLRDQEVVTSHHFGAGIDSWQRVVAGLLKRCDGEVLGKRPVVQHLRFGTLFAWPSQFTD